MKRKAKPQLRTTIDRLIRYYIREYSIKEKPIEVSFREILPELNKTDRYTHLIHTYPAKLLLHIPYFFLNNIFFSKKGNSVLDPFCGTGTVLLEAITSGSKAIGADANPIARLIAEVKTTKYDSTKLESELARLLKRVREIKSAPIPMVVNRDFWFPKSTQPKLAKLLKAIKEIEDVKIQKFFLVCFSNCIKKVSYADPRISVPVKLNPKRFKKGSIKYQKIEQRLLTLEKINVNEKFTAICKENIQRVSTVNKLIKRNISAKIVSTDARELKSTSRTKLKSNSINLIITSPPYAGAQKYIRSSSLSLGWLEMANIEELKRLDGKNIGRENYKKEEIISQLTGITSADKLITEVEKINQTRAIIVSNYLIEMKTALTESIRVLKKGGHMIIIVGNNQVCGKEFNTQMYLSDYLEKQGLKLLFKLIDDIKSYGLMTKRNKTADIISREWILVFKK